MPSRVSLSPRQCVGAQLNQSVVSDIAGFDVAKGMSSIVVVGVYARDSSQYGKSGKSA
jgi:hypothetical protein